MLKQLQAEQIYNARTPVTLANVPAGAESLVLVEAARRGAAVAYILSDGQRMNDVAQNLEFMAPDIPVLMLPGWDCLPYDRVSPSADAAAMRMSALSALIAHQKRPHAAIILISVNALLQKVPPRSVMSTLGFHASAGNSIRMDDIAKRLSSNGFERVSTVREVGEYAIRGGILDAFVPGHEEPVRLDFFGDTLESIRSFDPASQRTTRQERTLELNPMSEVTLNDETISRFRKNYLSLFGAAKREDALYQAISDGRRYSGMEHWLPLFYEELETVLDYLPDFKFFADRNVIEAATARHAR